MLEEDEDDDIDPSNFRDDIVDTSTGSFQPNYPIHKDEGFCYTFYEKKNKTNDAINQARILFDLREYRKACFKIKNWLHPKNQAAIFIYYYSLFLLTEQQSEEEKYY